MFEDKLLLKARDVVSTIGLSRSTIWRLEKVGQFPSRRRISPGRVGWLVEDVKKWLQERPEIDS